MNIDEKLNNMKPKDTPLLVIGYIILGMFLLIPLTATATDNEVQLDQKGDNVIIGIGQEGLNNSVNVDLGLTQSDNNILRAHQDGDNNDIFFSTDGDNNEISILQTGRLNEIGWTNAWGSGINWGGDLDGDSNTLAFQQRCSRGAACGKSDIGFHIKGNSNTVRYGQGVYMASSTDTAFLYDTDEGGNHTTTLDIHGDNNTLTGYQRNGSINAYSGHTATLYLYGDNQTLHAVQETDGAKTLNYTSNVDGTVGNIRQTDHGAHTATVVLNGTYPTNITLLQNSTTAQSYSITQNCVTAGGCTISVTQE